MGHNESVVRGQPSAGEERCDERHDPAAQRRQALVDRHRERDGRGAEQEMHELRALEVFRIRNPHDADRDRDREHRDGDRIGRRMPVGALVDQHPGVVGRKREEQREERRPRKIDPDLVQVRRHA